VFLVPAWAYNSGSDGRYTGEQSRTACPLPGLTCSWDKQVAALFGRHAFNRLFQISIDMPTAFVDCQQSSELRPLLLDRCYVEIFQAFISISAVLDTTLNHVSPHAAFFNSPFLDRLAQRWNLEDYDEGLDIAEDMLEQWRQ